MSTPQRIGRYQVRERIGSGGFATVWRAHDPELDNDVAVKILAENWIERTDIRARFVEEARLLRRADSDRVVRVYDIGTLDDGRPYFVMSYAAGGTLADRLTGGPLPIDSVLRYASSSALGVAILHDLGVLHRDIKPSNILFRPTATGEQLMIADLGLAKAIAHASGFTLAAGTPGYMAPEQARTGGDLDTRVDVYALGALTYQMLVGRKPLSASTDETIVPPSRLRPELGSDVDMVVMRALEHAREHRWSGAADFADAVGEVLDRRLGNTAPPAPPTSVVRQTPASHGGSPPASGPWATTPMPQQAPPWVAPSGPPATPRGGPPYPTPPPLQEHPSFPGQRRAPSRDTPTAHPQQARGRQRTPEQRKRRSRRLLVLAAGVLAVILLAVGGLVWYQLRPVAVRTADGGINAAVPRSWVSQTPLGAEEDMGDFGKPGQRGAILSTQSSLGDLDNGPGATFVASRSFARTSTEVFDKQRPPSELWDTSSCSGKPTRTKIMTGDFTGGELRVWKSGCSSDWFGQAILRADGYGVQVFIVAEPDQDDFSDVVHRVQIDKSKLP